MFIRRDPVAPSEYLILRVGLFFLAAGLWIAGVAAENSWATLVAIAVAATAILLGLVLRLRARGRRDQGEEGEEGYAEGELED